MVIAYIVLYSGYFLRELYPRADNYWMKNNFGPFDPAAAPLD